MDPSPPSQEDTVLPSETTPPPSPPLQDLDLPIAERRARRDPNLPKRYRNDPPERSAALPPQGLQLQASSAGSEIQERSPSPSIQAQLTKIRQILTSPRNTFGLFRQYFASDFPLHDPDAELDIHDLSDVIDNSSMVRLDENVYAPYPNSSSFALGEWYWNHGLQKTKRDFKHLIGVITDPAFCVDDIHDTAWDRIDGQLGHSEPDLEEWADEPDAGWTRTPVTIQVPFAYKRTKRNRPLGSIQPQDYTVTEFYHRSIVSILKERLSSPEARHFHMEPYKLYWQTGGPDSSPIRVQGEVYTSPAFLEAHNALQESAGVPGCDLPRVVVALMFASDATQLTSFGQARIWPLYMHFGNDSKYRRSRPSLHLYNHVAYFQKVSDICVHFTLHLISLPLSFVFLAPRWLQRLCYITCWAKWSWRGFHGPLSSRASPCTMEDHPR